MASSTKVGSTWKSINGIKVKVGSQWKTATAAYVKVNGVWKQWASALPDLTGLAGTTTTTDLSALGLSVINNNSSSSNSAYSGYAGGYVYSQNPPAGTLVGPGDTVTLTTFTYSGGGGGTPTPTPTQDSSVSYLSPASASAGTQLTIYGSFPSPITNIAFNGVNITYGSWSQTSTQITCTIPSGSGTVSVQVYNGKIPLMSSLSFTYGSGGSVPTPTPTPSPTATSGSAPTKISNPFMSGSGTTVTATGGVWSQTPVYVTFDFYKNGVWTGTTYTSNVWLGQSNSYSITGDAGGVYTVIAYQAFDFSGTSYGASSNNSYTVPSSPTPTPTPTSSTTFYYAYGCCNGTAQVVEGPNNSTARADYQSLTGCTEAGVSTSYSTALASAQTLCGTPTPTPTPSPTAITCSGTNCSLAACQTCDPSLSSTGTRSVSTSICSSGLMNTYTCYTPGSCANIVSDTGCVPSTTWYCTESYQCGGSTCGYTTSSFNNSGSGSGYSRSCSQSGYPSCQSTTCGPSPTPTPTPAPTLNCSTCTYGTATYACPSGYTGSRTVCITSVGCADYDLSNTCTPASPSPTPTPTPASTCVSNQGAWCGRYGNGTVACDGTCVGDRCC